MTIKIGVFGASGRMGRMLIAKSWKISNVRWLALRCAKAAPT